MNNRFAGAAIAAGVAVLALFLTARSLHSGFATDDHFIRAVFKGFPGLPEYARSDLNTFVFSDGDPERNRELIDRGVFPWWSVANARLAFWRPLASVSHLVDYRLWNDNPVPMHLENMLWYAVLCALASLLYRRFMSPPWVALFAALLFTIDENNAHAVGWLANRNMLMAAVCVVLILFAHDAWRRDGRLWGALAGPALLVLGFFCAEAVVAVGAYLLAYALFLDRGTWTKRFLTLVPYGGIVVAWNLLYRESGFGSSGSGWYTDPGSDPMGFLGALASHIPILLIDLFVIWPAPLVNRFDASQFHWIVILFSVVLFGIGWVLYPLLKRDPVSRFWLLGAILALVPVAAVTPQPRVVLIAGIGCAPLVARFLSAWATPRQWLYFVAGLVALACAVLAMGLPSLSVTAQAMAIGSVLAVLAAVARYATLREDWMPQRKTWRVPAAILAFVWVVFHVIVAPIASPGSSMLLGVTARKMEQAYATIPSDPAVTARTVVIVQAPTDFMPWHFSLIRASREIPYPGRLRVLSSGSREVTVERTGPQTLVLCAQPNLIGNPRTSVFRGPAYPMRAGDEVRLTGMTVRVLALGSGGLPREVEYHFDKPLDDPSFQWLTVAYVPFKLERVNRFIKVEHYVSIALPRVGETKALPALVDESAEYQALRAAAPRAPEPRESQ